jgi:hypothetical protein
MALKDVSFTYPTRPDAPVLQGVTLALEPGRPGRSATRVGAVR